jgi:hypothetical protein
MSRSKTPVSVDSSPKKPVVLAGHGLIREGAPYDDKSARMYDQRGGSGRGLCSCGTLSPVLGSDSQRKKWHRTHKDELR